MIFPHLWSPDVWHESSYIKQSESISTHFGWTMSLGAVDLKKCEQILQDFPSDEIAVKRHWSRGLKRFWFITRNESFLGCRRPERGLVNREWVRRQQCHKLLRAPTLNKKCSQDLDAAPLSACVSDNGTGGPDSVRHMLSALKNLLRWCLTLVPIVFIPNILDSLPKPLFDI